MVNPEFYGSKPWKQWSWSFGFQAYHHNYKILEICANKYWGIPFGYHDPNPKSLFYLKLGPIHPFSHFQNRFPEAMNDRGDDSKMFRNLAVQLCNSRTRAVSIIEALSTLAVLAVRAVPKSAGYREIWWNNFMAHLTGWVTCGLINLRFGEVQVPRKQSCNSPASQRFTFWIQLSAQACRQSDKLLPSEGIEGGPGRKEKKGSKSWPSMRFISNIIPAL